MTQFIFEINDVEEKALLTDMISIQEYFDYAVRNKVRHCVDNIVKTISDRQPNKISKEEKFQMVEDATLETALERNERLFLESLEIDPEE